MKKSVITFFLLLMSIVIFAQDFANFSKYEQDNLKIKSQNTKPEAVFMGDSITEGWVSTDPKFYERNRNFR
jgi:hypothetical protein